MAVEDTTDWSVTFYRPEGTKFKQEIIWLCNWIEQELKQILGKSLGNGIENHMKIQGADYFLTSRHKKPESFRFYKVWISVLGVQVYTVCDTQSEDDCRDDCIGTGPLELRWLNVPNCPGDPTWDKVQMVTWTCPWLRRGEKCKCFKFSRVWWWGVGKAIPLSPNLAEKQTVIFIDGHLGQSAIQGMTRKQTWQKEPPSLSAHFVAHQSPHFPYGWGKHCCEGTAQGA